MDDLDSACEKAQQFLEQSEADRLRIAEQEADKCPDCEKKDAEIAWFRVALEKIANTIPECSNDGENDSCDCMIKIAREALKGGE